MCKLASVKPQHCGTKATISNLKLIRKATGMSQIQLAQRAKISRFRLSLAEAGAIELRQDEIAAIRDAMTPEIQKALRLAAEFDLTGGALAP